MSLGRERLPAYASATVDGEDLTCHVRCFGREEKHGPCHVQRRAGTLECGAINDFRLQCRVETVFRHLLTRVEGVEVTGPVERLSSAVNGGIKHLPLRWHLDPTP